ncbi:putative RNA-directed DNA polymerase, partial [Tanacetum coccineum]
MKHLKEINHTFIALIPKVSTPLRVNNYRPISCCNVIYKCISKILTNRIIGGIKEVVSANQSAFVPGRRISDNILITQDLMRSYHRNRGPPRCAFKVDIQKAYDTVDWGKRGLRQGDPLSPYLFTLVMEVLTLLLKRKVRLSDSFRYHKHCEDLQLINVCFADDLFIFARGEVDSARIIMEGLDEFKLSSGLVPSIPKSTVYFCNVVNHVKNAILNIMPFAEGDLPVKYLGVPLISSRLLNKDCKVLIEQVKNRIGDWKNKSLSFAGRLQLCRSVLSSMQVYWASVLVIPKGIILDIHQLIRGFKWGKVKVAWNDICLPKSKGGLGLRYLDIFNSALMTTHIWNIVSNKESLWVRWIHTYKLRCRLFWDIPIKCDVSWGWLKLLQLRELVRPFFWIQLGNGENNSLWYDTWSSHCPLSNFLSHRDITNESFINKTCVAELVSSEGWQWPQTWLLKAPNLGLIPVPNLVADRPDIFRWRNRDGVFSDFLVSNAWEAICPRGKKSSKRIDNIKALDVGPDDGYQLDFADSLSWFGVKSVIPADVMGVCSLVSTAQSRFVSPGLDDVIKPKCATRSSNIDVKLAPKYTFSISKPALGNGRKSYKKGGSMGRDLSKSLDDMEYDGASSDGSDDKNDVEGVMNVNSDGNMVYDDAGGFVNQGSEDNRDSEGVNIEGNCEFNSTDNLNRDSELEDEVSSISKSNVVKNVEKSVKLSANDENVVGDMPVPFSENVILNPGGNVANDSSMSASGNNKLSRIPVRVNKDGNKVVDMDPVLEDGSKRWDLTLVGYVEGMNFVLENGPWLVEGKSLFVQKWEAGLCMEKPEPTRVLIWVRIMNVPLEAWNSNGISRLASSIGNPIIMDRITASMCEKAYGRASFARVLIEVDATKELPDSIEICYSKLGKSMKLRGVSSGVEENGSGGWQDVRKSNRSGASTSNNVDQRFNNGYGFGYRGGYNVRGRGGGGGLSGGRGGLYQKENNEGMGMKFVPVRNVGKRVDNVQVMEGEGSGNRANKGKNV